MSQPIKGTAVRLPLDLHTLISDAAATNSRSRHAEMLHRLESSFSRPVMMETDEALAVLNKVAEGVIAELMTRLFTGLEDRLAALIAKKMEAAEMSLITEVRIEGNAELFAEAVRGHDFTTGKRRVSPTGRLSESRPELQDLPSVSGINTLAASVRPLHCRAFEGATELVNFGGFHGGGFGGFHSGGFCGAPDGELPKILERGEQVMPPPDGVWFDNQGQRPADLRPNELIETKTRPHGIISLRTVGDTPSSWWSATPGKLPVISHWRPVQ